MTVIGNWFLLANVYFSNNDYISISSNVFIGNSTLFLSGMKYNSTEHAIIESNIFQNDACGLSIDTCRGLEITGNNFLNNEKNVKLKKNCLIREIPSVAKYKQHWINNYWSDWNQSGPYKIRGIWVLKIKTYVWIAVPVFLLLYSEYDTLPAKNPYIIP